jgi:hypothetical protein
MTVKLGGTQNEDARSKTAEGNILTLENESKRNTEKMNNKELYNV